MLWATGDVSSTTREGEFCSPTRMPVPPCPDGGRAALEGSGMGAQTAARRPRHAGDRARDPAAGEPLARLSRSAPQADPRHAR